MKRWKLPVFLAVVAAAAGVVRFNPKARALARESLNRLVVAAAAAEKAAEGRTQRPPALESPKPPWDHMIAINEAESQSIGLTVVEVKRQTEPMHLEVNGSTAYDPNTQSKIRPRFPSLIDKVYAEQGQRVEKGDPLVDLFSPDLSNAKSDWEKKVLDHEHDKRELARMEHLFNKKDPSRSAISEKDYLTAVYSEKASDLAAKLARDYLEVYGLTDEEIEDIKNQKGRQKAMMTLRAPASGVVINRDVVTGNRYDITDTLLVIAPLDHFWVWGNIYPQDAGRVQIGYDWVIHCQFLGTTSRTKIESITSDVDKDTKTVRIRTGISNQGGRMKSEMLVSGYVEIPADAGRTIIPRLAMVSTDGADYVYVRHPGHDKDPDKFERRPIRVTQEHHDMVIVGDGLAPGEQVAAKGSLILSQMYEDAATVESGAPL
jgi:cobalt-zinc-cadmium efflux system membrane fusion protein